MGAFGYVLPEECIAKYPLPERDLSRLLIYREGKINHTSFHSIPDELPKGSLLVFNNTRVIKARIPFQKDTGAGIEIFCLEPVEPPDHVLAFQQNGRVTWKCLVGNSKKWKGGVLEKGIVSGTREGNLQAERMDHKGEYSEVMFHWDLPVSFADILESMGHTPIPPYLKRNSEKIDELRYQTVYSRVNGSVAAPTAGLHFTDEVLYRLRQQHFSLAEVTLHVGAGTFKPVASPTIAGHDMHTEVFEVSRELIDQLLASWPKIVAVGTTSVRTLESLDWLGVKLSENARGEELWVNQWDPYVLPAKIEARQALVCIRDYMRKHSLEVLHSKTRVIIVPGYSFRMIRGMVTNFHQPKSTLLLLIAAFIGDGWQKVYDYALNNDFRFLSYGDSSLLLPWG